MPDIPPDEQERRIVRAPCAYCHGLGSLTVRDRWQRPSLVPCAMCAGKGYVVGEQKHPPEGA